MSRKRANLADERADSLALEKGQRLSYNGTWGMDESTRERIEARDLDRYLAMVDPSAEEMAAIERAAERYGQTKPCAADVLTEAFGERYGRERPGLDTLVGLWARQNGGGS